MANSSSFWLISDDFRRIYLPAGHLNFMLFMKHDFLLAVPDTKPVFDIENKKYLSRKGWYERHP